MEIAAMHHPIGCAKALKGVAAKIKELPDRIAVPQPHLLCCWLRHDLLHGQAEPQCDQDARSVGAELNASAELVQLIGLFVELNVEAALDEGKRRGETAEPGAG